VNHVHFIKRINRSLYCGNDPIVLRGFGLGGWLLPEGYMWKLFTKCDRPRRMEKLLIELCGSEYADSFWKSYYSSYITEFDIELIASKGYNSVRLPLNARHLYHTENGKYIWNEEMFSYIDQLIDWCKKQHVYVILDMHGAPGGQTGANIDDSLNDQPELFMNRQYQLDLLALWTEVASRYVNEWTVAGYDLLNEPLPNWFSEYNDQVVPLYNELIQAIRSVDPNHLIIIEGVHWATDFSIFDRLKNEDLDNNIMLQFHKYWSPPDQESLAYFLEYRDKLNLPLFMGEGGENNLMWYSAIFQLYDQLNISWSFWSYKKMENTNSPMTFSTPKEWNKILEYINGDITLSQKDSIIIFNHLLLNIQNSSINHQVFNSLSCTAPIRLHCEFYTDYSMITPRRKGAQLRNNDQVNILFENGKTDVPDYKRYGGEQEPKEENLMIEIQKGESLTYNFVTEKTNEDIQFSIFVRGEGHLQLICDNFNCLWTVNGDWSTITTPLFRNTEKKGYSVNLSCLSGKLQLDYMDIHVVEGE
jgi:endoglucanase